MLCLPKLTLLFEFGIIKLWILIGWLISSSHSFTCYKCVAGVYDYAKNPKPTPQPEIECSETEKYKNNIPKINCNFNNGEYCFKGTIENEWDEGNNKKRIEKVMERGCTQKPKSHKTGNKNETFCQKTDTRAMEGGTEDGNSLTASALKSTFVKQTPVLYCFCNTHDDCNSQTGVVTTDTAGGGDNVVVVFKLFSSQNIVFLIATVLTRSLMLKT